MIRQFLYYPTRINNDAPVPAYARGATEQWFTSSEGTRIHGLYWAAPLHRPTILFCHGNAQSVYEWAPVADDFADLDCGLYLFDYPGYGKSSGAPTESALYAAGRGALEWLLEQHISESQIIVFGKSLGGGVATEICQERNVLGLVLESTFTSIPAVIRRLIPFLPADTLFRSERYESILKIGALSCPVLIIHGSKDELIPLTEGKNLYERASEPKELFIVTGAGHNDVAAVAGEAYGRTLRSWIDTHQGGKIGHAEPTGRSNQE